jgi:hypothetical protein
MLGAWADLRGSMRAELDREPSEGRLLFFAMFAGLIWFLGQAAVLAYGPLAPTLTDDEFTGRVAWEFITSALFVPLFYYVLAAIGGALARAMGGVGSWRDSRAALFWAALVAAPAMLAAKLLALLLDGLPGPVAGSVEMLGEAAFAWTTVHCFAEAHGFASAWKVLATLVGLVACLAGGIYLLGRL